MKASGKRKKGQRLELKVCRLIKSYLGIQAKRSFQSGAHWSWKSDIYAPGLNYSIECKNQERVNLWKFWEQAESQRKPLNPPVLVISGNYRPELVVMDIRDWLNLVKEKMDWEETAKRLPETLK